MVFSVNLLNEYFQKILVEIKNIQIHRIYRQEEGRCSTIVILDDMVRDKKQEKLIKNK